MQAIRIDILRHGEPEGGRRYRGHGIDDPLSALGWRQMWAAVGEDWPWDGIWSSPMARCLPFAEQLADRMKLTPSVDERLKEVGFGAWEGKTGAQLRAADPDVLRRFYADPVANRPAGAEPLDAFRSRVGAAIDDLLDRCAGHHLLVVAHAGVMRAAVSWLLQSPLEAMYRLDIPNAAMVHIRADGERPPMISLRGPRLD